MLSSFCLGFICDCDALFAFQLAQSASDHFVLAFALRFPGYHRPAFIVAIPRPRHGLPGSTKPVVSIPWCHHKFRNYA